MKPKNIALLGALGLFALCVSLVHNAYSDAQGGNTAGAVQQQNGQPLNTVVLPAKQQQVQLINNLGISGQTVYTSPMQSGTGLQVTSTTANVTGYVVPEDTQINSSVTTTTGTGSIVISGTAVKIYLSSTNGLLIVSGSVSAISGTGFNF